MSYKTYKFKYATYDDKDNEILFDVEFEIAPAEEATYENPGSPGSLDIIEIQREGCVVVEWWLKGIDPKDVEEQAMEWLNSETE